TQAVGIVVQILPGRRLRAYIATAERVLLITLNGQNPFGRGIQLNLDATGSLTQASGAFMRLTGHAVVVGRMRPGFLFYPTIPVAQWLGTGLLCQSSGQQNSEQTVLPQGSARRINPSDVPMMTSESPLKPCLPPSACADKPEKYPT